MGSSEVRPMRVLMTVQAYYPFQERGGPVFKVRSLARSLAHRGHQVVVLTADLGMAKASRNGLKIEPCRWGWRAEEEGVEAIYLSSMGHYRALTLNPHVIGFCGASLSQFDLVHFYGLYDLLGPAVSYFCRRQEIPYVIEPMGMYRPIDRSFRLKQLWHSSLGGGFWRNARQIIATSEMEEQELLDDGVPPTKLVMRYNGIESGDFANLPARGGFRARHGISATDPLVLFLGRLIPRKGADVLIRAFARACPDLGWLVIAGPEGEPGIGEQLRNCARETGILSRVLFTGPLYGEEKNAALADANLFVLPSRYENFANAAAEAMACGVPVIVTEYCGIRSLVDGRAGLVVAPELGPLADAIRRFFDDKILYNRMKEGCRSVTNELRWEHLAERMENFYREALTGINGAH
jgi:glycosyltransferase involved in cell wall biosynthesis